ncbi:CLUMA_CG003661, isoform A [Clunio marinus]|uniref:CLUMA_CG003661, isoform A n=1 Tax=Clunio marinus TaxID=568069 RepID=A0A1J1HPP0_9DIPT|nr:CLUMA_CG003661, isoform A [Clunio marinus]
MNAYERFEGTMDVNKFQKMFVHNYKCLSYGARKLNQEKGARDQEIGPECLKGHQKYLFPTPVSNTSELNFSFLDTFSVSLSCIRKRMGERTMRPLANCNP